MKNYLHLFLFAILLNGCKSASTNTNDKQVKIYIDSALEPYVEPDKAIRSDNCKLRFHTQFNNDTVVVLSPGNPTHQIIATTQSSLGFAGSYDIRDIREGNIKLTIRQNIFSFPFKKGYMFVDIYYDPLARKLEVHYSNNILVVS